jgi:hypothetical protein
MNAKEKAIIEKRTIEAIKKNFMGPSGKLGMIARFLGKPIIKQGSGFYNSSTIDHLWNFTPGEDEIPTFEEDQGYVYNMGYAFDGLSNGMHIEVIYIDTQKSLKVTYKGYEVYSEVAGDLLAYAPFSDWEDLIERLYVKSKERKAKFVENEVIEQTIEGKKRQQSWLQKLRYRWGI